MMGIEDFARVINLARIVYQVEVDGVTGSLIDVERLRVDVCPPGVQGLADPGEGDATPRPTPQTWRITIGENDDGDLARGEGATLTAAVEDLRRVVEARADAVRNAMRAAGAP